MKKIFCIKCNKYRKFKNAKILYLSITSDNCVINDEMLLKEEELIEILKVLGLTNKISEQKYFQDI